MKDPQQFKQVIRAWLPPLFSLFMMIAIGKVIFDGGVGLKTKDPKQIPPSAPGGDNEDGFVSGTGVVEPSSETYAINSPLSGLIQEVCVQAGQKVQRGQLLFRIESSVAEAELTESETAVEVLKAQRASLQSDLKQATREKIRGITLAGENVISKEEVENRVLAADLAANKLNVLEAQINQAEAEVAKLSALLARHSILSPMDGTVLQVLIHPGESITSENSGAAPISMGNLTKLCVRIDVDQEDIWRFDKTADAIISPRGAPEHRFKCHFFRTESVVAPKRSLSNDLNERVDTRVLQVIYELPQVANLIIGQQVDVFIPAKRD